MWAGQSKQKVLRHENKKIKIQREETTFNFVTKKSEMLNVTHYHVME
jgi:hypothetical protein